MHKIRLLTLLPLLAFIPACSLYAMQEARPTVSASESYAFHEKALQDNKMPSPWWNAFSRPTLNALIEQSLIENQTVLQAAAALKQARALNHRTGADRFPSIDGQGGIAKGWEGSDAQNSTRELGINLSWEIDLFGRINSATKADEYEAFARASDLEATKLSLSANVATAYFGAVAAHRQIALLKDQLRLDRKLQNLLQLRLDNGIGTNVDLLRQKARVTESQTLIPLAEADLAVYENRLDVLLGQMPDGKYRVAPQDNLSFTHTLPPLDIPAALLVNRPDLKALQAELIAADADIAAAIADRLPRITLDGSYAYSDTASFTGPVSMIIGTFVQPLIDWGKRKAEVERNEALYEGKLAAYTQAYLEAVEEVENTLIREQKQREFLQRLTTQQNILKQTVDSSESRYTQGIDDYFPVIDALQELRRVERDLINRKLDLINIRITLYRAIGAPIKAITESDTPHEKDD